MLKVTVRASISDDIQVTKDFLRIYFSKFELFKTLEKVKNVSGQKVQEVFIVSKDNLFTQKEKEARMTKEIIIEIEKSELLQESKITLVFEGRVYCQVEKLSVETFREEKAKRARRQIHLALHKVMVQTLLIEPSPWGILTGVRPTKIVYRLLDEKLSVERIMLHLTRDYALNAERAQMLCQVAMFQYSYLPAKKEQLAPISVYIGIPFCPTRCYYCSFPSFSLEKWGRMLDEYLRALSLEIKTVGTVLSTAGYKVQNVYIGGGTPTILSEVELADLLRIIEDSFQFAVDRELTVEGGRPDTLTREKLQVLKEYRVTRLSINPQTMSSETLVTIGRKHTIQEFLDACKMAREIDFPVINTDLIIGLPGENCAVLEQTLTEILKLRPENITLHALAMKRAAYYRQEQIKLLLPTEGAAMMDLAHHCIKGAGYFPYYLYRQKDIFAHGENVGYSLSGSPCFYNLQMIAERQTILGFGVGSSSKFVNTEDWSLEHLYNPKDIVFYLARIEKTIQKKVDKLQAIL